MSATDTSFPRQLYGVRKCRGHWHVVRDGEDIAVPGDPFPSCDAALDAANELNWIRDEPDGRTIPCSLIVTVPELTGCCANCGAKPEITLGPVNDTVCISVKPTCDCIKRGAPYSSFNLWPANGVSAALSERAPAATDTPDRRA